MPITKYPASPFYNVRDFYARGDGVTDDTAAVQAALNAASTDGGGIVIAPQGTYLIDQFISIPAYVTLRGEGMGVTLFKRKVTGVQGNLCTVRLAGNYAYLRDCSVEGRWDPANPTVQTYDMNVVVYGNNTQHTRCENVESYHGHLGFNVGGIIGDPVESFSGQSYNEFVNCYAHDTYDLGFGLVAKDRTDAGTCIGCKIVNCTQESSYATAGLEIRYQRAAMVNGFNTRNNTNSSLGAGIRLEETNNASISNVQSSNCYMGLQYIHDSYECEVNGWESRSDQMIVYSRASSDLIFTDFVCQNSSRHSIFLTYLDGTTWTRNNERMTFANGFIKSPGNGAGFFYGVYVVGTGFTEANLANNGFGLKLRTLHIKGASGNGILIEAGGNFSVEGCVLEDNLGGGAAGVGIVVNPPAPNAVTSTTQPAGGFINNCLFINTGVQPNIFGTATGTGAGLRLVRLGRIWRVGAGALSSGSNCFQSTPAQITSNQNDYSPTGAIADTWRISSDAARDITGILANPVEPTLRLMNVGAFTITLKNQNAGSSANNRIITGTGADLAIATDASVTLEYDNTTLRWRVVA